VCKNPDAIDEYLMDALALVGVMSKESKSAAIEPNAKVLNLRIFEF
jgi:D-Tyr-tRNAtyr deacylase